jgi:hypothetical protein
MPARRGLAESQKIQNPEIKTQNDHAALAIFCVLF